MLLCFKEASVGYSSFCVLYLATLSVSSRLCSIDSGYTKINIKHWWNDIWQGKIEVLGEEVFHCHLISHKSHVDCLGMECGLLRCSTSEIEQVGLTVMLRICIRKKCGSYLAWVRNVLSQAFHTFRSAWPEISCTVTPSNRPPYRTVKERLVLLFDFVLRFRSAVIMASLNSLSINCYCHAPPQCRPKSTLSVFGGVSFQESETILDETFSRAYYHNR